MKVQIQWSVGLYSACKFWHLLQLFEIMKEYCKWESLVLILSCLIMRPTFCHAKWCCLIPGVLLTLVLWVYSFIYKFCNISVEIWAFLQHQDSLPFLLVQYVALRPSQCKDFHTEHCLVWRFNVVYLMHMCFFRIMLGVCDSVHEISFLYHWFELCAVQDHHQFNSVLYFKVCLSVYVFIFLYIWNLTVTVVFYLVDNVTVQV